MDSHIINLLKTNNRVIIPEFGAFIVKSGSPRTIVFNEFLKYNDEVLLKEICRAENISDEEASKKLDEFTRELNSQLDLGQHHKMGKLGMLSKDNNGRIHFQMFGSDDVLESSEEPKKEEPEKIELKEPIQDKKEPAEIKTPKEPFEITKETKEEVKPSPANEEPKIEKPVEEDLIQKVEAKKETAQTIEIKKEEPKKDDNKKEKEHEKKITASSTNVKDDKKQALTLNDKLQAKFEKSERKAVIPPKEEQKKEKGAFAAYLSDNKNIVWYGLLAVVIVAIAIWFLTANKEYLFDSSNSKKTAKQDEVVIQPEETNEAETEEAENLNNENAESANTAGAPEEESKSAELPKEVVNEPVKTQPAVKSNQSSGVKRYYIVAGCFQQESNADNYVNYLNGQGYNSVKFGKYGGLFAVSFDSFSSFSDAQKELNKIKKSTEPEAWILYY